MHACKAWLPNRFKLYKPQAHLQVDASAKVAPSSRNRHKARVSSGPRPSIKAVAACVPVCPHKTAAPHSLLEVRERQIHLN